MPSNPLILVTAAGAKSALTIIEELLANKFAVRAMFHHNSSLAKNLKEKGVEICYGDLANPEDMYAAMKGVSRAYLLHPMVPYMLQCAAVFIDTAVANKVEHIVCLSQWLASPLAPSLHSRQHYLIDRLFEITASSTSGMTYTIIRPGFFADNYLGNGLIESVAQMGKMVNNN